MLGKRLLQSLPKTLTLTHNPNPQIKLLKTAHARSIDRKKLSRERLLLKCYAHGIQGSTLTWIRSFLTGRSQRVVVNGADSSWSQVTSGIPQGSVLGPLLFLLFFNDMPDDIMSSIKIFADDTKVYKDVQTEEDMLTLQKGCVRTVWLVTQVATHFQRTKMYPHDLWQRKDKIKI